MKRLIPLFLLVCAGCTSQGTLDPNTVAAIEQGVNGASGLATALAPLLGPTALIVGSALATALGVWRKLKPRYMAAENKAELANAVSGSIVDAIDILKKDHPAEWDKLRPLVVEALRHSNIDAKVLENVIRGLRGLPPKG